MSNSLNIGLIGSGFMGQAHTDAYRRAGMLYRNLPATPVLYAIADQNDQLAEEARRKLGFEVHDLIQGIGRGEGCFPDFEFGARNQEILEAMDQSSRSETWVSTTKTP
jgi:hypothetical protein